MDNVNQQKSFKTLYKKILDRSKKLFLSPENEWSIIYKEKADFNEILGSFVLPYIFVATILRFINSIFSSDSLDFTLALRVALSIFASSFFMYLISYYVLKKILPSFLTEDVDAKEIKSMSAGLIAYSSVSVYIYSIVTSLIPQMSILLIVEFYAVYLIWIGLSKVEFKQKDNRLVLTIIISALIICMPFVLSIIISQLSNIF